MVFPKISKITIFICSYLYIFYNSILPVEFRLTGGGGGGEVGLATLRRRESIDDGGLLVFLIGARI